MMNTEELLCEINSAFPLIAMPDKFALGFHPKDCHQCAFLAEDLEEYRGKAIDDAAIRQIHQQLTCLSAQAWLWILPHYLRFCLTQPDGYNHAEIEYLLYGLGPDVYFAADTRRRLSLLNSQQVDCLIRFVARLQVDDFWSDYCPAEIARALGFLRTLRA